MSNYKLKFYSYSPKTTLKPISRQNIDKFNIRDFVAYIGTHYFARDGVSQKEAKKALTNSSKNGRYIRLSVIQPQFVDLNYAVYVKIHSNASTE